VVEEVPHASESAQQSMPEEHHGESSTDVQAVLDEVQVWV
jgi:hypothetical protein